MEHALPRRTAGAPRTWQLCMTSENHGTVGPAGCTFSHSPEKHERVLVVEVPAAANKAAEEGGLHTLIAEILQSCNRGTSGRIIISHADEEKLHEAIAADRASRQVANKAEVEREDDLLEITRCLCSIAARRAELSPERAKHYPHVDEEGSPTLMAARAACVVRGYTEDGLSVEGVIYPVTAQAGQVAVPTDEVIVTALHACAIDTRPSKYGFPELQVDATNVPGIRAVYMKIAAAMQASTSGERQEGGRS